jgi:peptide/nickel transport system substrate-binding protein
VIGVRYAICALVLVLGACAPARQGSSTGEAAPSPSPPAPKNLTIAISNEPTTIEGFTGSNITRGSGLVLALVHAALTDQDDHGVWQPRLAGQRVSAEDGTLRLNPDGSMDVIWKLRSGIQWHDGTPFTSGDMLFTFKVKKDPAYPSIDSGALALMESATAPDPQTFIVHWTRPFYQADQARGLDPLPEHILGDLYARGDSDAFVNSPYFTSKYVGLGPYRLAQWHQGSEMDFVRFDPYFLGRPALDTVVVRFISDANTMISSILAGAVDVVYPPGVDFDAAVTVRDRWQGTNNVVRFEPSDPEGRMRVLEAQYRPEYAQPRGALTSPVVRRGLYQAIDRPTFVEIITHGLAAVADSWIPPFSARRAALEDAIPAYPYDPARAQQLLAEAGWRPGADGVLANDQSGQRFELTLRASQIGGGQVGKDKELTVVADFWKRMGVEPTLDLKPIGTTGDRGYEGVNPGVSDVGNMAPYATFFPRMNSRTLASEANRWTGNNLAGYSDPAVDSLLDRYNVTIDASEQQAIERQLLQKLMGEVANMPLYWEVLPVLISADVDPTLVGPLHLSEIYRWDRR